MALKLIEGFDHLSSITLAAEKAWNFAAYTTNPNTGAVVAGRVAGNAVQFTAGTAVGFVTATTLTKTLPSTYTQFVVGFAHMFSANPISTSRDIAVCRSGTTLVFRVAVNLNGRIVILNSSGTVVATGTTVLTTGSWYYIECKVVINGASGSVAVQLNGASEIGVTTGNFGSSGVGDIQLYAPQSADDAFPAGSTVAWDDVYFLDTTATPNNTFLGDVHVETIYPASAGAHTQWTPNAGSNFSRVNEHTVAPYPDGDTTYNADSTVGDIDTYIYDVLSLSAGTVFAVQTNLVSRKTTALLRQIAPVLRSGAVDRVGNNVTLATSYIDGTQIYETDPSTSAAWTVGGVNATQFGAKVTT